MGDTRSLYRYRTPGTPRAAARLLLVLSVLFSAAIAAAGSSLLLPDLDGKIHNTSEYIGKRQWVIVAVWSADCPICRREMYHMTFLHEEHKDKDVRVLGFSIDGYGQRDKALEFANEQSLNFPNVIGNPGDAARLSGHPLAGTPTYYFFAPDGKFMTQRVGALSQTQAEHVLDTLRKTR